MKKLVVLVEYGEYYNYDEKTGEECVMDKKYTTCEVIRVMVYNTGMNVYVWKIADNLGE